jgi:hypothetical protein
MTDEDMKAIKTDEPELPAALPGRSGDLKFGLLGLILVGTVLLLRAFQ